MLQGSVLGPLLFLIYVNDIPVSISHSSVYLFADDTKILKVLQSNADAYNLQEDLNSLDCWSDLWLISLNALKCSHLTFSLTGREQTTAYKTNGSVMKGATSYKDLGIKICTNLSWSEHISFICSKAYTSLHVIKRNLPPTSSAGLRKKLYLSLVRSHLSYCSQLWRPLLSKDTITLEKVQRRASKFILQDYTSSYKERLLALDLLPISLWLELLDLLFLVKCLLVPPDNFQILDFISFVDNPTRAGSHRKLAYKFNRTSTSRHFYFNRVVRLWNSAPAINLDASFAATKAQITNFFWNYFTCNFDPDTRCTHYICCPCAICHQT